MIIDYINRYKSEYGVERMCRVLSEHGRSIAPSTYYEALNRPALRRAASDDELKAAVSRMHAANYSGYGARKVWLEMRREGIDLAAHRRTVDGCTRARRCPSRQEQAGHHRRSQSSRRGSGAAKVQPGCAKCVVVGCLYLRFDVVRSVYVAFVIDAYSRQILGWRTAPTMMTPLVLEAIEHAIWTRHGEGITDLSGLIHLWRPRVAVHVNYVHRQAH